MGETYGAENLQITAILTNVANLKAKEEVGGEEEDHLSSMRLAYAHTAHIHIFASGL
jgi:hypothetical protein